ncbi:MAG: cation-translocating P-type ATPase [Synechococcaceae cyanobacterium SM2_3_2]|nr:cation-translocating P-type ATPase [Synechococcaceae cyanobacterium SM2_3_2]
MPTPAVSADLPWYCLSSAAVAQHLDSNPEKGLTAEQVRQRREQFGSNELVAAGGRSRWDMIIDQFTNVMLLMLFAVAIISGYLEIADGEWPKDAVAIFIIVGLNGILGYLQEAQAEKALAALQKMSSPTVTVRRQGQLDQIRATELVPGDWVLLETGIQIPADGRLWEAVNLQVREAALTGESLSISKRADLELTNGIPLGDRLNMAYQGTEVMQGRGLMLVTETGMKTELGKVAGLLNSVESEPTPLQLRMDQLGKTLVTGSLILVAVVVLGGLWRAGDLSPLRELLTVSLSMAVAVVPEGLPAVITVTLAIGTQRMVRRRALIRRLPAVETLGSVTTICTDKTGTLTENKMVVVAMETGSGSYTVTGSGYSPTGEVLCDGVPIETKSYPDLTTLLTAGVLCNDATLQQDPSGGWEILGDPTEGALLTLGGKAGLPQTQLKTQYVRSAEIPFTSERKRMSVVVTPAELGSKLTSGSATDQPCALYCKGSPELILKKCQSILINGIPQPLSDQQREQILAANNHMAQDGIRVLGFGTTDFPQCPLPEALDTFEDNLVWVGLVGMRDAARPEVKDAIEQCRQAGIRPIMITGDHKLTALAIAKDLNLAQAGDVAVEGETLSEKGPQQLGELVKAVNVYARVAPEHKLWIVQTLQKEQHEFVAMTGDGVNDAPAIKQANIGIAMGITGTDVSREASDMVLLDDNFATIVAAIEEGRIVYSNIRRFIKYILGSNIGEVLTVAAAPLLGLGLPLSTLQILWMNLVTDGLPALALAMEPAEEGIMNRLPVPPTESIFARGLGSYMVRVGIIFALTTISMMVIIEPYMTEWRTMVFTMLCLAQMGHALSARSSSRLVITLDPRTNPYLYWSVGLTTLLQLALIYVPVLQRFFGLQPLSLMELMICVGFSALVLVWVEMEKVWMAFWIKRQSR